MKVLYFTKYSRNGASSRLRSYQFFPFLEKEEINVTVKPFFNEIYLNTLYRGENQSLLLILNAYSLGFSALVPENLLKPFANKNKSELSIGELYLNAKSGVKLPLGVWGSLQKS